MTDNLRHSHIGLFDRWFKHLFCLTYFHTRRTWKKIFFKIKSGIEVLKKKDGRPRDTGKDGNPAKLLRE